MNICIALSPRAIRAGTLVLIAAFAGACNNYGGGGGNTQTITVAVAPKAPSVVVKGTQQFTATVTYATNTAVTWQVDNVTGGDATNGTISGTGLYTAPATVPAGGTATVKAISQADSTKSDTATVTITPPPPITVTVSPKTPSVAITATQQFTATVANTSNTAVTWQVGGTVGGNATVGTITAGGLYTAPVAIPGTNPVTVTAVSQADNTKSDSATVTITTSAPVTVAIAPLRAAITTGQTQSFTAKINGTASTAVTWEVDTVPGGNPTVGTISASGVYTPGTAVAGHNVVARSTANTSSTSPASTVAVTDLAGVFTYHNDISRTGANTKEYALNTSTVKTATFGKLFTCAVDAAIYAQPLWVANLSFGGTNHNVVYVATERDSVYAFDADNTTCTNLWGGAKSLLGSGETWVSSNDNGCGDLAPDIGITGTPVIDPATNTIYLVTKTKNAAGTVFHQRLHALDLVTGNEKASSPVDISGQVNGTGGGSSGGIVSFDPFVNAQRPALLLSNDTNGKHVVIAWASHCDFGQYHGWVMSYNPATLAQEAIWNATPNGVLGGIWMAGGGLAADSSGNIYFATGNGTFNSANSNYGDAIVKLGPPSGGTFPVLSFFAPNDQASLEGADLDLGSGGLVLLPTIGGSHPQLLAQTGKDTRIWILDRASLGGNGASNNVVHELDNNFNGGMWGAPAFWNNHLYFGAAQDGSPTPTDPLRDFSFSTTDGSVGLATQTLKQFGFSGPTPSVSSNGTTGGTGIVWALDNFNWGSACSTASNCQGLYAYDATNLGTELWDSNQAASARDLDGGAVKFTVPTVANGKVYAPNQNKLTVYGLLPN